MNPATVSARRSAGLLSCIARTSINASRSHAVNTNWQQTRLRSSDTLPKIAQPSIWTSIIPKFIRDRESRDPSKATPASKEWNPATFFIIIFILIGSQAIQLLVLRKDFENFNRSADAKLELLREVIQKLKNGEHVDVEKLLGTGDESKEREWEEVLREIEREDSLWRQKSAKNAATVTDASQSQPTANESKDKRTKSVSDHNLNSGDTSKSSGGIMSRFY
ncbi:hypothetical protein VTN77DRAFT_9016 [Rasamsonia byssochlamydoides]|uniref:uncharacterized protein n=1 Tax=Rasamsonia byssochlamydoides TaxID=89139 RepID=UPI003742A9F2